MHYAFFLERLYFCFQFCYVLFAPINGWTPTNFFWRRCTRNSFAKNTPFFTLIVQRVFSFSRTAFSFHFSPWFLFRSCFIFASRSIWTSGVGDIPNRYTSDVVLNQQARVAHQGGMADCLPGDPVAGCPWRILDAGAHAGSGDMPMAGYLVVHA
jgi:hypothetical protein